MTERTLRISARMAEEIQQWASDELSQWPRDTAYAADLENLLSQLTAAAPDMHDTIKSLCDEVDRLRAENKRLRAALAAIVDGIPTPARAEAYRTDGEPSKLDKCCHGLAMYEECGECVSDFARAALAAMETRDDQL